MWKSDYTALSQSVTASTVKEICQSAVNTLSKYNANADVSELSDADMLSVLESTETVAMIMRRKIADKTAQNGSDEIRKANDKNIFGINVSYINRMLVVDTPLTLQRKSKSAYLFGSEIGATLNRWQRLHPEQTLFHDMKPPFVLVMIRYSSRKTGIQDNDNIEAGRIINAMFTAIGYSDNVLNMSLYSTVRIGTAHPYGVSFIVFPKSEMKDHLDLF